MPVVPRSIVAAGRLALARFGFIVLGDVRRFCCPWLDGADVCAKAIAVVLSSKAVVIVMSDFIGVYSDMRNPHPASANTVRRPTFLDRKVTVA
jgi:hypothetical protein